jgi:hypothetical protein
MQPALEATLLPLSNDALNYARDYVLMDYND